MIIFIGGGLGIGWVWLEENGNYPIGKSRCKMELCGAFGEEKTRKETRFN